jgi:P27 family predicted phage terminase small subunit
VSKPKVEPPPKHLKAGGAALWRSVVGLFELAEHDAAVLTLACEARDRLDECAARIAAEGATVPDRYGNPKPHPLLNCERDSRAACLTGLRMLGLNVVAPGPTGRPPGR